MRLELTGRHVDITPALRKVVSGKLAKLERLLNDSALSAQAVLSLEKRRYRTDITLHARGEKFLHGVGASGKWETSVKEAVEKLAQQALTLKGKWQERKRRVSPETPLSRAEREAAPVAPARTARPPGARPRMPRILRTERRAVKAMSVTEAAHEIDASRDGVVVFRDAETSALSVLYRSSKGELTLIEMEA
jgi:putative sigma-54 modulation protein